MKCGKCGDFEDVERIEYFNTFVMLLCPTCQNKWQAIYSNLSDYRLVVELREELEMNKARACARIEKLEYDNLVDRQKHITSLLLSLHQRFVRLAEGFYHED